MESTKLDALLDLGRKRASQTPSGYSGIGEYHNRGYETGFVSPYTKSACNVDSPVFILLQDWLSSDRLSGPFIEEAAVLGRITTLPTDRNLTRLLMQHFYLRIEDTFATNLFPYVKPSGMSSDIKQSALRSAAIEFAIPQIETVGPRLVIVLGLKPFNAIAASCEVDVAPNLNCAIENPFRFGDTMIWCQAHTGALGQNNRNRGGVDRSNKDWAKMARWYAK